MNAFGPSAFAGFYNGLFHPFLIPAHLLALVVLGLMLGRQPRLLPVFAAFVLGLAGGLLALAQGAGQTPAPTALLIGTALAGLATAAGFAVPGLVSAPLAAAVGLAVGLDSPPQATALDAAYAALAGTAVGAAVLVGGPALAAARLSRPWQRVGVRILGSWIAASAVMVLAARWAQS